ncbi:MAG TPA: ABC transporter permease subunit [Stellaceae bacterium]|nr:ABC transporter permease subunit [Stellaceae bacterium]
MRARPPILALAPLVTIALFLVPIAAGLGGTLLPAFGWFPAIGGMHLSLRPWAMLFAYPGFATALRLTLAVGIGATLLSLGLAIGISALAQGRPRFHRLEQLLTPLLAAPHAAAAIGFAFLLAPSGWIVRLLSPWLTGWHEPPALVTIEDPLGLAFIAGLLLKEVPYLVLMIAGAAGQVPVAPSLAAARSMGYSRPVAWLKIVLPQVYPQIRLPVYAVLAFSLSVVEVGLVLGPSDPPTLPVLAARWFADYDLRLYFPAAAAASLQLVLVVLAIASWRLAERVVAGLGRLWIERGGRRGAARGAALIGAGLGGLALAAGLLSLAGMAVWSLAASWRFPEFLPAHWSFRNWARHADAVLPPAAATAAIAAAAALLALALALLCLENEQRRGRPAGNRALWLLYLPLLVPQIAFLFGAQVILVRLGLDGSFVATVWAHLLFVLPYVFLSLADPWRSLDPRFARIAAGLGAGPWRVFFRVKLPMLLRPLLTALAVGFAVSVGQYLPTVFAGAGRIATLTTEAVTLSGGGDRRIVGLYAFLQAVLPLLFYSGALLLPALIYRRRKGMA